jgi:hypothetical protein
MPGHRWAAGEMSVEGRKAPRRGRVIAASSCGRRTGPGWRLLHGRRGPVPEVGKARAARAKCCKRPSSLERVDLTLPVLKTHTS